MNDFEFRYPGPQILNMLKISYMPTSEILTEVLAFRWQQHDYTFLAVAEPKNKKNAFFRQKNTIL